MNIIIENVYNTEETNNTINQQIKGWVDEHSNDAQVNALMYMGANY